MSVRSDDYEFPRAEDVACEMAGPDRCFGRNNTTFYVATAQSSLDSISLDAHRIFAVFPALFPSIYVRRLLW